MPEPIACTLSPDEYRVRAAEIDALARALAGREPITGGVRLTFAGGDDLRPRLEDLVAREAECCPFLTMELSSADGTLVLDVTGPPEARPAVEQLFT